MGWLKEWLRRWVEPEERVILLPTLMEIPTSEYLQALERVSITADGRIIIRAMQDKYFGALNLKCPQGLSTQARSEWLAGRDALLVVRREMLDDFQQHVNLLPVKKEQPGRLKAPQNLTKVRGY